MYHTYESMFQSQNRMTLVITSIYDFSHGPIVSIYRNIDALQVFIKSIFSNLLRFVEYDQNKFSSIDLSSFPSQSIRTTIGC